MRRALSLILDYIMLLIFGTLIGFIIYLQYFGSISLVAGRTISLSRNIIIFGIFKTLPIIYLLLPFGLMLYKIRHKSRPVLTAFTYTALCLFTWLLLYPFTLRIQEKLSSNLTPDTILKDQLPLSKNYFRTQNGNIYYFISDEQDGYADVITVHNEKNSESHPIPEKLDISNTSDFYINTQPFRDPLIKDTITDIPFSVIKILDSIKSQAINAKSNGYISWLAFASLGFALCGLYAFIKMSSWHLINAFTILALSSAIIFFNYF